MTEMLTARCANLTYSSIHCTESSYGKNSLHWADIWQEVIATRQDTQFWLHLQLDNVYYIDSLHCWGQSKWDWFWRFWTKDWLNDISKKEEKYNHVQRRRSPCSRTSGWERCLSTSPGGSMSLLEKGILRKNQNKIKKVWKFCFLGNVRILLGICTKCNSF